MMGTVIQCLRCTSGYIMDENKQCVDMNTSKNQISLTPNDKQGVRLIHSEGFSYVTFIVDVNHCA